LTSGASAPIGRIDLHGIAGALPSIATQVVPIVAGFRAPSTAWLGVPGWLAAFLGLSLVASVVAVRERPFTPFFQILVLTALLLFLASGAFVDAQSYRYLMPAWGALAVVLATGVWRLFRWSRVAGIATFAAMLLVFGLGQRAWYRQLAPDREAERLVACLDHRGVRAAFADYWLSYKLTFLSGERVIVAPDTGVDRYPAYTAFVRSQGEVPRVPDRMGLPCA
jgi:hypothetical protein